MGGHSVWVNMYGWTLSMGGHYCGWTLNVNRHSIWVDTPYGYKLSMSGHSVWLDTQIGWTLIFGWTLYMSKAPHEWVDTYLFMFTGTYNRGHIYITGWTLLI